MAMPILGKSVAAPLLIVNFLMYLIVMGFASWSVNKFINGQSYHPGLGGNGATMFFVTTALLASVVGVVSKVAGGNHIRAWRNDSLSAAASSSLVAWSLTALAFGFAVKEIRINDNRGWRLKVVEAFIIILTFTQLLYLITVHAGMFNSRYGPSYRNSDYAPTGTGGPLQKGTMESGV